MENDPSSRIGSSFKFYAREKKVAKISQAMCIVKRPVLKPDGPLACFGCAESPRLFRISKEHRQGLAWAEVHGDARFAIYRIDRGWINAVPTGGRYLANRINLGLQMGKQYRAVRSTDTASDRDRGVEKKLHFPAAQPRLAEFTLAVGIEV